MFIETDRGLTNMTHVISIEKQDVLPDYNITFKLINNAVHTLTFADAEGRDNVYKRINFFLSGWFDGEVREAGVPPQEDVQEKLNLENIPQ